MSRIEAGTIFFMDAVLSKFDRRKSFQAICDPPGRKKKISIPNMVQRRSSSFFRVYVSSPCGRQGQSRHLVEGGRNTPRGPFFFSSFIPKLSCGVRRQNVTNGNGTAEIPKPPRGGDRGSAKSHERRNRGGALL